MCILKRKKSHSIGSKFVHNFSTNLVARTRRWARFDVSAWEMVSGTI